MYGKNDRRRAAGFNIFVLAINLGSFSSPIIVGGVQKFSGFHVAFVIPAVFMIAGLIVFYTLTKSTPPSPILPAERKRIFTFCAGLAVVIAVLAAGPVCSKCFNA